MGDEIALTGIVLLIVSIAARHLCDDNPDNVPLAVKVIVVFMFLGGFWSVVIGMIMQIWA